MTGVVRFGTVKGENIGPFASFELNLRDRGLLLVLGDNRDTTAADNNGSGKSHILKAISWCLWDKTSDKSDTPDALTRKGSDQLSVSVDWDDDTGIWRVTRSKKRKSSMQLVLEHNEHNVSGHTIDDTQLEISKRLGMDFKTWCNTVLYAQGDVTRFADPGTGDAERKLILKRILRLDVLDQALKGARARADKLDKQHEALLAEAATVAAELRGLDTSDILASQLANAEAEAKQYTVKARNLEKWRDLAANLRETIGDIRERYSEVADALDEASKYNIEATKATARVAAGAKDARQARAGIAQFANGLCPTCGSPSSSPAVQSKCDQLSAALVAAEAFSAQAEVERQAALENAAEAKARSETIKAEIDAELSQWQTRLDAVRTDINNAEHALIVANNARRRAGQLRAKLKGVAERKQLLQARAAEIVGAVEALEVDKHHIDFWVKGFSNTGLSSYMMDSVMPLLTERANHYLDILADGDIQIAFDTQSLLKSGEAREKLAISWTIEGESDTTPSGGQRKKISIAVDLALMDLVAARERSAVDLLLMDEMLDGLDATGRNRVMVLLSELRQRRSTIVVISHDSSIAELFESTITVRKANRVSVLIDE